jgi:hypothetical protein
MMWDKNPSMVAGSFKRSLKTSGSDDVLASIRVISSCILFRIYEEIVSRIPSKYKKHKLLDIITPTAAITRSDDVE